MNGEAYYKGLGIAARIKDVRAAGLSPRRTAKIIRAAVRKAERQARVVACVEDDLRYRVRIPIGFRDGKEVFQTLIVSLNELKEGFRRNLVGRGSYPETVTNVKCFLEARVNDTQES